MKHQEGKGGQVGLRVVSGDPVAICLSFPRELFALHEANEVFEVQAALDSKQTAELGAVLLRLSGAMEALARTNAPVPRATATPPAFAVEVN